MEYRGLTKGWRTVDAGLRSPLNKGEIQPLSKDSWRLNRLPAYRRLYISTEWGVRPPLGWLNSSLLG
jgi:hypothetical protein